MILTVLRLIPPSHFGEGQGVRSLNSLNSLSCHNSDFAATLEITSILIQHADHIYRTLLTETPAPYHPTRQQQFLEALPPEFSRKDYIASSLSIPERTAEKHIAKFVQNALISHFAHDKYKKT
jgi:hypothetical protein